MNNLNDMLEESKKEYEKINMPQKYEQKIDDMLSSALNSSSPHKRKPSFIIRAASAAAASLVLFAAAVNTDSSIAYAAYDIPVLGNLARLVTFRQYSIDNITSSGTVTIPKVENIDGKEIENMINSIIQSKISELETEQANLDEEYRQAFLATGGKEEDYIKVETTIGSKMHYGDDSLISFELYKYQTLAPAYNENFYYTIDVDTGRQLTLRDLLGDGFAEKAREGIVSQIKSRTENDPEGVMYHMDLVEVLEITEDTSFYVNEAGNTVIVFPKYAIAPGYMGAQEFIIAN